VTTPSEPSEIHELTGAYVLDALTPDERAAFERRLADRHDGDREVLELGELRRVAARLAVAVAIEPTPSMRDQVLARVRATPQYPARVADPVVTPIRVLRGRIALITASVAAAAAIVSVGVSAVVVQRQPAPPVAQARQSSGADAVFAAPDATTRSATADPGGSVTTIVSRREGKVVVAAVDLPALDSGHAYQVWLIGSHGPLSGGLLHTDRLDQRQVLVADLPADAAAVAITAEPAAGSAGPTSTPIVHLGLA